MEVKRESIEKYEEWNRTYVLLRYKIPNTEASIHHFYKKTSDNQMITDDHLLQLLYISNID
jgi:hypothetical protein